MADGSSGVQRPGDGTSDGAGGAPPPADIARRRRQRNLALALSLAAFIILVYLVTILRIGGSLANRTF